ncbi:MAG: hypothetical protein IH623_09305 [Verrucomicrobia bacterium]|nr:hypothetical protein [Verrucomicrobiota bacterium]
MKPYPIQLEISGPTALWTRPDTGSSPALQYPLRLERGEGRVRCRVRLCAPVQFYRYTTNYGGPLRASDAKEITLSASNGERAG